MVMGPAGTPFRARAAEMRPRIVSRPRAVKFELPEARNGASPFGLTFRLVLDWKSYMVRKL